MFEEIVSSFISASKDATLIEASRDKNVLNVKLVVDGKTQQYTFSLGTSQSVLLPVKSRSRIWNTVQALHEYQKSRMPELLASIESEIKNFEITSRFPLKIRLQALFFIATTGINVNANESLVLSFLMHGRFTTQISLFRRLMEQSKAPNLEDSWKTFCTDSANTPISALVHEMNSRVADRFSNRVLLSVCRDTLEWGIKSPNGDYLGRARIMSVEVQ